MKGRGRSVACDWLGRSLYWLEQSADRRHGQTNAVVKYDLERDSSAPRSIVVLPRPASVTFGAIQVDPTRMYIISYHIISEIYSAPITKRM